MRTTSALRFCQSTGKDISAMIFPSFTFSDYSSELLNYIDPKIDPCEDFYSFACGGWVKKNPLPDKRMVWNQFTKLEEESNQFIRDILQSKDNQAEYSKV